MNKLSRVGIDLAKNVFQLRGCCLASDYSRPVLGDAVGQQGQGRIIFRTLPTLTSARFLTVHGPEEVGPWLPRVQGDY